MGTVALVYTPLAPLVPLLAAVVFWISGIVYKYQLMFVFTTKVESGGVSLALRFDSAILILHFASLAPLECCHQPLAGVCHIHAAAHGIE